jgi:hypothetical protein
MRPACSLPQPIFRPGGRSWASRGVGAVKAGAGATRSAAQGVALTAQAHPAATLGFCLAGLGLPAFWAPPGGQRERWRRPQRTEAARVLRLKARTATARGGRGAKLRDGRPPQPSASCPRLERAVGDPPYAQRSPAGGVGGAPPTLPDDAWQPRRGGAAARRRGCPP